MQPNPTFEVCPMEMILTFTEGPKVWRDCNGNLSRTRYFEDGNSLTPRLLLAFFYYVPHFDLSPVSWEKRTYSQIQKNYIQVIQIFVLCDRTRDTLRTRPTAQPPCQPWPRIVKLSMFWHLLSQIFTMLNRTKYFYLV